MIDLVRMAAMAVCLGGWSGASSAGAMSDLSCSARAANASLSPRTCTAGSTPDIGRGPDICIGQTARARSRAAPFTVAIMMKPAHQNLCLKASSSVSLSHFALQAQQ